MITQPNILVRNACKHYGVPLWALAQHLGISEITLIRKMRKEFSDERKKELIKIIRDMSAKSDANFSDNFGGDS